MTESAQATAGTILGSRVETKFDKKKVMHAFHHYGDDNTAFCEIRSDQVTTTVPKQHSNS